MRIEVIEDGTKIGGSGRPKGSVHVVDGHTGAVLLKFGGVKQIADETPSPAGDKPASRVQPVPLPDLKNAD